MKEKIISIAIILLAIIAILYKVNTIENKTSNTENLSNSNKEQYIESDTEKEDNNLTENPNNITVFDNQNTVNENVLIGSFEENKNMQNTSKVIEVTEQSFELEVLKSEGTIIVDFYADWCGPCKALSPILEDIANENSNIKVCKVNVDIEQNLASKYGAQYLPTLLIFKDGEISSKIVGFQQKSYILDKCK